MIWLGELGGLLRRVGHLFTRRRERRALDEELRFHVEMREADFRRAGYSETAAARLAHRAVGDPVRWREEVGDVLSWGWVEGWLQDARFAVRALRRGGVVTVASAGTLALGMGGVLAVFTLVDVLVLRSVRYPDSDRLAVAYQAITPGIFAPSDTMRLTLGHLERLRDEVPALREAGHGTWDEANIQRGESVERIRIGLTTGLFRVLGVAPMLGRIASEEEESSGTAVAVLSHAFWSGRLSADRSVLGSDIVLNGVPFTVIGVMPREFRGLSDGARLWIPTRAVRRLPVASLRIRVAEIAWGTIVVRLPDAGALARVEQDYVRALRTIEQGSQATVRQDGREWMAGLVPMDDAQLHPIVTSMLKLLGIAVSAVLLIVVANVTALMLARVRTRRVELAVRASLGAGRGRLRRQMIVEGVLLASIGGACGLLFGYGGAMAMARLRPVLQESFVLLRGADLLERASLAPTWAALGVTLLLVLVVGTVIGLVSARAGRDGVVGAALRSGGDHTVAAGSPVTLRRGRGVLVVSQVALATALLMAAGLTLRSLRALLRADPGFRAERVLVARLASPGWSQEAVARRSAAFARLSRLPGVAGIAAAETTPLEPEATPMGPVTRVDDRTLEPTALPAFEWHGVTGGYFAVLGIPVLRGDVFPLSADESPGDQPVLVNATAARLLWPGADPIGRRIGRGNGFVRVIGVVGDVRQQTLRSPPAPGIYWQTGPWAQVVTTLYIRSARPPAELVAAVREVLAATEPGTSLFAERMLEDRVRDATSDARYVTMLLLVFGSIAALLAAIGVYGVLAWSVVQRRREFGLRLAVGAQPRKLVAEVVREGALLLAAGVTAGLLLALAGARVLRAFLHEIQPGDPLTLVIVATSLVIIGIVATMLPALRAGRTDPMVVLRDG